MDEESEELTKLISEVRSKGFVVIPEERTIYYNCHKLESTNIKPIKKLCSQYGFVRQARLID